MNLERDNISKTYFCGQLINLKSLLNESSFTHQEKILDKSCDRKTLKTNVK